MVTCDDHVGPHVFREPDTQDDENCSNPVDMPGFEHAYTENWSIGWYLCTCGEPWLNQAQRCITQPGGIGYQAAPETETSAPTGDA
jgi:hypothetical protein